MVQSQTERPQEIIKTVTQWDNDVFGTCQVRVHDLSIGQVQSDSGNSWAPIYAKDYTKFIELRIVAFRQKDCDVAILHFAGENMTDVTVGNIPPLRVPVEWKEQKNGGVLPFTRKTHVDNADLIYLRRSDGRFVHLQISVVVRYGQIWMSLQEVYAGQIVFTSPASKNFLQEICFRDSVSASGEKRLLTIVPAWDENAYQGSNYFSLFSYGVQSLMEYADKYRSMTAMSDSEPTRWNPQELEELDDKMTDNGWSRGITLWYNQVIGWGFILCEDQRSAFVHFSAVIDEEGRKIRFPMLMPMVGVALRYKEELDDKTGQMQRKAISVRTAD